MPARPVPAQWRAFRSTACRRNRRAPRSSRRQGPEQRGLGRRVRPPARTPPRPDPCRWSEAGGGRAARSPPLAAKGPRPARPARWPRARSCPRAESSGARRGSARFHCFEVAVPIEEGEELVGRRPGVHWANDDGRITVLQRPAQVEHPQAGVGRGRRRNDAGTRRKRAWPTDTDAWGIHWLGRGSDCGTPGPTAQQQPTRRRGRPAAAAHRRLLPSRRQAKGRTAARASLRRGVVRRPRPLASLALHPRRPCPDQSA